MASITINIDEHLRLASLRYLAREIEERFRDAIIIPKADFIALVEAFDDDRAHPALELLNKAAPHLVEI